MKKLTLLLAAVAVASLTLGCKQSKQANQPEQPDQPEQTSVEQGTKVSPAGYEV